MKIMDFATGYTEYIIHLHGLHIVFEVQFKLKFNIFNFATARSFSDDGSFEPDGIGNSTFFVVFDELIVQIFFFLCDKIQKAYDFIKFGIKEYLPFTSSSLFAFSASFSPFF